MISALLTTLLLGASRECGPLDLDTALALAAERSDEVAIRQADVAGALADQSLAGALRIVPEATATLVAGPAPEAHGTVVSSPDSNREFEGLRPFGRIDVQVVQPLFTWGRLDAARDAAAAGVRAREDLVQDAASQVQLRVVQLYWGVSLARRLLSIVADVEKALSDADRRVRESLAKGDGEVGPSDRHRLDLFRAILGMRGAEAQKGLELARVGLAATLATAPERLLLREEPLEPREGEVPDPAAARAAAGRQRSDLRALDEAIAARDAEVAAAEGARLPQVFLAGLFTYGYAPNRDIQLNPWVRDEYNVLNVGVVVGLRQDLSLPILSAKVEKARAERAALARQRDGLARLVQVQVDTALADVNAAGRRLAAARAALGSGRSLFRSVGLDFSAGLIEARVLIEAYALYVETQFGAAQAAYDLLVARAKLAQAVGDPPRRGAACELP
jgi:outer membrane protein TolC